MKKEMISSHINIPKDKNIFLLFSKFYPNKKQPLGYHEQALIDLNSIHPKSLKFTEK